MKFANLVLQSPILTSRHDLFPAAGRSQAALRHQPTPGEQLVWGDAMPTSHQAYRHTRLEGLFDHANQAWFREDTEVIDFFAPPREDFLLGGKPAYMSEG